MSFLQNNNSSAAHSETPGQQAGNGSSVGASAHRGNHQGRGTGSYPGDSHGYGAGFQARGRGHCHGYGAVGGHGHGESNRLQCIPDERTRNERQEEEPAMGSTQKHGNLTGQPTSKVLTGDQVTVDRGILGETLDVRPSDPRGPENFIMPSSQTLGAMDVVMNPSSVEGLNAFQDVTPHYRARGFRKLLVTVQPLGVPCVEDLRGVNRDSSGACVIAELADDADTKPTRCEACKATSHGTEGCPIPSRFGDTTIDPFCGHSVKAITKGDKTRHPLDGNRGSDPMHKDKMSYCPRLIALERQQVTHSLLKIFIVLVVDRRRMPPLRVARERYCFIKVTLDVSELWCDGEMPGRLEGAWPYTMQDALKHRSALDKFDALGWTRMPKGELEDMHWATIRREYEAGRIPKQFLAAKSQRVVVGPVANTTTTGDTGHALLDLDEST